MDQRQAEISAFWNTRPETYDQAAPAPDGLTVREAQPGELEQARALMLRILDEDLGYGYNPEWYWDIDDLQGAYLENPRQSLLIAADDTTGVVIGTTAIRTGGPQRPAHPQWLCDRYDHDTTAQLFRVFVLPEHRRRGVARVLVRAAQRWVADEGGYRIICLHTNAKVPAALPFWRPIATEVFDARGLDEWEAVHFDMPIPQAAAC